MAIKFLEDQAPTDNKDSQNKITFLEGDSTDQAQTPVQNTDQLIASRQGTDFPAVEPQDAMNLIKLGAPSVNPLDMVDKAKLIGKAIQTAGAIQQREESAVAGGIRSMSNSVASQGLKALIQGRDIRNAIIESAKGLKGEQLTQLGDVARDFGVPEAGSAALGFIGSFYLPTSLAGGRIVKALTPVDSTIGGVEKGIQGGLKNTGKMLAEAAGAPKEALAEAEKIGFREVLQKRYFDRKFPAQIQTVVEDNLANLEKKAGDKFDELVKPLANEPFDKAKFFESISQDAKAVQKNPFKGAAKDLNDSIMTGLELADKTGKMDTLGGLLETRRNLDELIFTGKKQGVGTKFGEQVRKSMNEVLHENPILKAADNEWYTLESQMKEIGNKVSSDTGENFLARFNKLTEKQKSKLVNLEKEVGGTPFIADLTKYGLSQEIKPSQNVSLYPSKYNIAARGLRAMAVPSLQASESFKLPRVPRLADSVARTLILGGIRKAIINSAIGRKK